MSRIETKKEVVKIESKVVRSYYVSFNDCICVYLIEKIDNKPYNIYHCDDYIGSAKTLKDAIKIIKRFKKEGK